MMKFERNIAGGKARWHRGQVRGGEQTLSRMNNDERTGVSITCRGDSRHVGHSD
jgi:hypothetical protein